MSTKWSVYDVRRRYHGEMLEAAVLEELIKDHVISPIHTWPGLVRPKYGQPFLLSVRGSVEQPLDDFGYVWDPAGLTGKRACIIEIKAMRASNWHDFKDSAVMHNDKHVQHA